MLYWRVLTRAAQFRFGRSSDDDFWAWLFVRVNTPASGDFCDESLVWYLMADAIKDGEHLRVAHLFEKQKDVIEKQLNNHYRSKIQESIKFSQEYENECGEFPRD